ncbi:Endopolyphosphatase [Malassezia pachydermatis]|uniref:Ppn1-vacuolar endopolyphosphatase n=1 Tax=Malassezia pachydermatis TaxID=77020 RepID=A0A0M8MK01_9BASI|nr:ppn1-vacuolar endopolyphosphatase [Malassezia pachydermatis]KOS14016.1 ppn1-vacuolar endopolyphosphatase [Malassezia pachydermatis]
MQWLAVLGALASAASVLAEQHAFQLDEAPPTTLTRPDQTLTGRFLHITDMHIDMHYKEDSAVVSQCHHNKPYSKHGGKWRAGYWGSSVSDCDAPHRLPNATMQWIAEQWAPASDPTEASSTRRNPFDFILWTGDSARHDQDPEIERTSEEIQQLNRDAVAMFAYHFPGVPLVPNFGNNDIVAHNTMMAGPSKEIEEFARIWEDHIPKDQRPTFLRGGFYAKDLIPNKLGVISLNTLYFYDSNKAVDGCPRRRRKDEDADVDIGTLELEWLTDRLIEFRRRNMQVHIIGHVPPTAGNYYKRCFDVYTELVLRFQDTILAQHFGHMNLDAFFVQESSIVNDRASKGKKGQILYKMIEQDLRYDYESLPGNARTDMDYYSVFYEAPSMVPTYLPSFRVWTYNISMEHSNRPFVVMSDDDASLLREYVSYDLCDDDDLSEECVWEGDDDFAILKKDRRHRRPKRKHRRRHAKLPRYASPSAPSRTNTHLSLLGYSQWVMDLDRANAQYENTLRKYGKEAAANLTIEFDLEYATYEAHVLWHPFLDELEQKNPDLTPPVHHHSPEEHHIPVPKHLLSHVLDTVQLDSPFQCNKQACKFAKPLKAFSNYALEDMTLRSVMDLARRLVLEPKLWKSYVHRLYCNSLKN